MESTTEISSKRFFEYLCLVGPAIFLGRLVPKDKIQDYVHFTPSNARDFLILKLLTEVQKVGFAMQRWNTFLNGRSKELSSSDVDEQMLDSLLDEQSLWQRKLLEGLVLLINFSTTNEPKYYYHFFLSQEHERYWFMLREQEDFFNNGSAVTQKTLDSLAQQLSRIEEKIGDLSLCWYLSGSKKTNKTRKKPALISFRQQLKSALKNTTRRERTALGYTYDLSYSETSGNIHFDACRLDYVNLYERFSFGMAQCGALALAILQRSHDLTNMKPEGINVFIMKYDRNSPSTNSPVIKSCEIGDFVFAGGPFLGKVIDIAESVFGYQSYLVKYIEGSPVEGVIEAWLPSVEVHLFMQRKEMMEGLLVRLKEVAEESGTPMLTVSEEELQIAFEEAATEMWKAGIGDYVKRNTVPKRKGDRGLGYHPKVAVN